jgi:hypothetical protein
VNLGRAHPATALWNVRERVLLAERNFTWIVNV